MLYRSEHSSSSNEKCQPSSHANYWYLSSPEKQVRLRELHASPHSSWSQVEYLKLKLAEYVDNRAVPVDNELHQDLSTIVEEQNFHISEQYNAGSFQRVFWEQQLQASKLKSLRSIGIHL